MVSVVKAGTRLSYAVEPGVNGQPMTAHTVSAEITVAGRTAGAVSVSFEEAIKPNGIQFASSVTTIDAVREFAVLEVRFLHEDGSTLFAEQLELVIQSDMLLRPGQNSFGLYEDAVLEAFNRVDLAAFNSASKEEKIAALVTAYYNIGRLGVSFKGNSRYRHPVLPAERAHLVRSTQDLDAQDLDALPTELRRQLMQAQLIEADDILGGNPIERQRLAGLLSHSAGESTHFYRTTKPLDLPVNRKTAQALWGIISYAVSISR